MQAEESREPKTFEEAYERLRRSVEELEGGPLPLEAAIARYEEGMRLAQLCNDMLDKAELRIQTVLREADREP
ncbi:MAG: xseB [Chloroflexi bacterium]|nr:xseB [Chloroflexota bacterium]